MFRVFYIILFLLVILPAARAQSPLQASHIDANVSDASQFDEFLRRDLLAYFRSNGQSKADRVDIKLLRDAPTQSGVAYPKYYVWAKAFGGNTLLQEGAVRVAAIDKVRFEVTDFVSKGQLRENNGSAEKIFPVALVENIKKLAAKP